MRARVGMYIDIHMCALRAHVYMYVARVTHQIFAFQVFVQIDIVVEVEHMEDNVIYWKGNAAFKCY